MDGYFLRDEDIIGDNPGEYKTFDLVDWKVSPTTDFSLESAGLNFATENLLDRVTRENDTLTESWLSVLNTKESWSETKTKSLHKRYLNEQVVPDQCQGEDQLNQKTKTVPVQEIQNNLTEVSSDSFQKGNNLNSIHISGSSMMDNVLKGATVPENSNNSMFIVDHKEQVISEQERLELPPANSLFTFNAICEQQNVEKITKDNINVVIPTETIKSNVGESLSNSAQATFVCEKDNQLKIQNSKESTSESDQPESYRTNIELGLGKKDIEEQNDGQSSEENEISLRIRKRISKLLTIAKIPKCMMVDYKFDSSNELPSFAETFCPNLPEEQSRRPSEIELPEVLKNVEDAEDRTFIVLPDIDSAGASSNIEQDDDLDKCDEPESRSVESTSSDPKDIPKIKVESEVMEAEPEALHKAQKIDTPSSMLAIDDEFEKYLVSSIMLNGTSQNDSAQLPDLSNNIGSLLTSDGISEDQTMELVYGNLFSKSESPLHGVKTCKQEQSTGLKMTEAMNNYQANLLNAALLCNEKPWQEHSSQNNMNILYGNVWTRSEDCVNSRYLTNNTLQMNDPFMSNTAFKTTNTLPAEIMQTDSDPFKFTNLVPKVEVVDSSLNYGF